MKGSIKKGIKLKLEWACNVVLKSFMKSWKRTTQNTMKSKVCKVKQSKWWTDENIQQRLSFIFLIKTQEITWERQLKIHYQVQNGTRKLTSFKKLLNRKEKEWEHWLTQTKEKIKWYPEQSWTLIIKIWARMQLSWLRSQISLKNNCKFIKKK